MDSFCSDWQAKDIWARSCRDFIQAAVWTKWQTECDHFSNKIILLTCSGKAEKPSGNQFNSATKLQRQTYSFSRKPYSYCNICGRNMWTGILNTDIRDDNTSWDQSLKVLFMWLWSHPHFLSHNGLHHRAFDAFRLNNRTFHIDLTACSIKVSFRCQLNYFVIYGLYFKTCKYLWIYISMYQKHLLKHFLGKVILSFICYLSSLVCKVRLFTCERNEKLNSFKLKHTLAHSIHSGS